MKNPLRDEAAAFRLVLVVLGAMALLALASWISTWLGVAVFVLEVGAGFLLIRGGRKAPTRRVHVAHAPEDASRHRILVVANETVGGDVLIETLTAAAAGMREEILVVCPALNSKVRTWTSDEDGARLAAQRRLETSLERLHRAGVEARGEIGDGDPLQAIEDALQTFAADEIVISTHPPGRSYWLEAGVPERAAEQFDVPVSHVVVDLGTPAEVAAERSSEAP